jgi:hypothetical protein
MFDEIGNVELVSAAFLLTALLFGVVIGVALCMLSREPPCACKCKRRPGRRYAFESVPDSDVHVALPSEPTVRARRV